MAAQVEERYQTISGDQMSSRRMGFRVLGARDEDEAITATESYIVAADLLYLPKQPNPPVTNDPVFWRLQSLVNVQMEEVTLPNVERDDETGVFYTFGQWQHRYHCPLVTFDFGTVTQKITQALATTSYGKDDDDLETWDIQDAINPNDRGGVDGTDIRVPTGRFNIVWNPPNGFEVDTTYIRNAYAMIGKVNDTGFVNYAAGEVLMTGMQGRIIDQSRPIWEITYGFEVRFNQGARTVAGIEIGATEGWQHIGLQREEAEKEDNQPSGNKYRIYPEVFQIDVQKIYETANFLDLFREGASPIGNSQIQTCPDIGQYA